MAKTKMTTKQMAAVLLRKAKEEERLARERSQIGYECHTNRGNKRSEKMWKAMSQIRRYRAERAAILRAGKQHSAA